MLYVFYLVLCSSDLKDQETFNVQNLDLCETW